MVADMGIGAGLYNMLTSINVVGLGADPIILLLCAVIAFVVCQDEVMHRNYTNALGIFLMSALSFYGTGVMVSTSLFIAITIIGFIGIVVSESTKHYRTL